LRILFAGTPAVALPALDTLLASPHDLVGVITRPDAPAGRGRVEVASPVARRARDAGVELLQPTKPSDPAFLQRLRDLAPDCVAIVAYGALVPPDALEIPTYGWVNLHFSLLPAWRGAAPVQHAILHGDAITGATTFVLEAGLDTGPVLGVLTEEIRPRDTAGDLLDRLAIGGAGLLLATLDGIETGDLKAIAQSPDGVSLAPKLTPGDARVDWNAPAMRVDRLVRACTPTPGPWTTFRGRRVKLGRVSPAGADDRSLAPGAIGAEAGHHPLVVAGTSTSPVVIESLQPEGKAMMPAVDWARGARLTSEDRFD
jgi:methionyl-tRNA formyltransferase